MLKIHLHANIITSLLLREDRREKKKANKVKKLLVDFFFSLLCLYVSEQRKKLEPKSSVFSFVLFSWSYGPTLLV